MPLSRVEQLLRKEVLFLSGVANVQMRDLQSASFAALVRAESGKPEVSTNPLDWSTEFYGRLLSILSTTAQISRVLWPAPRYPKSRKGRASIRRGAVIRADLKVPEDSILSDRRLRNILEHFDEHVEKWFQTRPRDPDLSVLATIFSRTSATLPIELHDHGLRTFSAGNLQRVSFGDGKTEFFHEFKLEVLGEQFDLVKLTAPIARLYEVFKSDGSPIVVFSK